MKKKEKGFREKERMNRPTAEPRERRQQEIRKQDIHAL
jgi:hypothetical protein